MESDSIHPDRIARQRWSSTMVALHWLIAIAILATMTLGWIAADMPRSLQQYRMFGWHKSFGLLVLALAVLRLAVRLRCVIPAPAPAMPDWERRAAGVSHVLLYVCMFAMPISGWLINSAADVPFRWFWLVPVPSIAAADPELAEFAESLHNSLLWILLTLIAVHAGAALRHHFWLRDPVLLRMLPWRRLQK
jgi:cytochrome b561